MFKRFSLALILTAFTLSAFAQGEPKYSSKRTVNLELEEVDGATSYEIELTAKGSDKPQTFKMKTPLWKAAIKPAEYSLRMRSYDSRGVPGIWSEALNFLVKLPGPELFTPALNVEIKTSEDEKYEVNFKWQEVPGTKKYRIDIIPLNGGEPITETSSENSAQIKIPVAKQYSWTVTAISKAGEEGEVQETPGTFSVIGKKLASPKINKPEDIWVEKLSWEKVEFASSYTYAIHHQTDDGKWEPIDKQEKTPVNEILFQMTYPGGHYKIAVKAEGPLRETSNVSKIEFDVFSGDRSPASIEESKLRYSLEKPTPLYFVASYLVTRVQYQGLHGADGNRTINYNAPGGTGRLGLGYTNIKKNVSYLGILDMTGVTLDHQNVTWVSAEGHYVWRKTWGRNLFRPSAGLFYKELRETKDFGGNQNFIHDKVTYAGPHVGFDFWRPLTYRLGWQVNARAYYGYFGLSTPNGKEQTPQMSYQMGIMGSYRIQQNIMGFMGWAHREDHATYEASPSAVFNSGPTQDAKVAGDYLNLLLEWGF